MLHPFSLSGSSGNSLLAEQCQLRRLRVTSFGRLGAAMGRRVGAGQGRSASGGAQPVRIQSTRSMPEGQPMLCSHPALGSDNGGDSTPLHQEAFRHACIRSIAAFLWEIRVAQGGNCPLVQSAPVYEAQWHAVQMFLLLYLNREESWRLLKRMAGNNENWWQSRDREHIFFLYLLFTSYNESLLLVF